jgi:hypothetical protein
MPIYHLAEQPEVRNRAAMGARQVSPRAKLSLSARGVWQSLRNGWYNALLAAHPLYGGVARDQ